MLKGYFLHRKYHIFIRHEIDDMLYFEIGYINVYQCVFISNSMRTTFFQLQWMLSFLYHLLFRELTNNIGGEYDQQFKNLIDNNK